MSQILKCLYVVVVVSPEGEIATLTEIDERSPIKSYEFEKTRIKVHLGINLTLGFDPLLCRRAKV